MGRKRRGESTAVAAVLLAYCLHLLHGNANAYGEVGCLFSKNLCKPNTETCYNDYDPRPRKYCQVYSTCKFGFASDVKHMLWASNSVAMGNLAFGRCIQLNDNDLSETDLYQYNLEPEELELLRMQLERLEYEGYKWPHDYTQCVMQILLDDLRYRMNNDIEFLCRNLKQNDFNDENQLVNKPSNIADVDAEALVKYMSTNKMSPLNSEYANEFYYPERRKLAAATSRFDDYDESFYDKLAGIANPDEVYRRGSRSLPKKSTSSPDPYMSGNNYALPREYVEALSGILDQKQSNKYTDQDEDQLEFLPNDDGKKASINVADYEKAFSRKYKYPSQLESVDFLDQTADEDDYKDNNDDDDDDDDEDDDDDDGNDGMRPIVESLAQQTAIYPEGGTIMPTRREVAIPDEYDDLPLDADLDGMLWRREMAGFKRRERLDVKKPGPLFSTNNYAFKTPSTEAPEDQLQDVKDKENDVVYLKQVKKDASTSILSSTPKTNVDTDHVYIQFNREIATWPDGKRIVNILETLMGLQQNELEDINVGEATITFKVPRNSRNYNASDVVHKIGDARTALQRQLNAQVIRYGIGKDLPTMLEVSQSSEMSSSLFGALVAAGVAGVTAAAIVVLIIARRHAKSRAKLAGLRTPDPEASKDYQELCRARMAAKQSDKVTESPRGFDFGRLIESGKSESNRSSTSSWGDEPQTTQMDVATGHVVLSYMEEHLKNQEKLDEEWAALCAYEAEPCSTAIAEAEGNAECNRPGAALPYDHSRVILNDLTNLNNSDYINASTITDHDPRNPAYIATQGPLPQTTADFWQLVWEQGSVVIVMLTRLTEDDQSMCHRYWPEEGSELYHIYEVHLVSEHVWCNEYLVRSFYLKNLRTGETRTVTQFHYLDWPHNQVPKSTKTLLEFRRKVNKSYRGRSCPIIVHCSDGAGRTGTYCLIDMVLNRMSKGAKEIDIAATLEHIRDQRPNMVADKQQFEFSLMAVAEEVHSILKSLPIVAEKSTTGDKEQQPQPQPQQQQQQQQSSSKSDK